MRLCRYPHTLKIIKKRLLAKYPDAVSEEGATDDVHHTLWMIEQVATLGSQGEVDRAIGWIAAKAHSLGLLDAGKKRLSEGRKLMESDLNQ